MHKYMNVKMVPIGERRKVTPLDSIGGQKVFKYIRHAKDLMYPLW